MKNIIQYILDTTDLKQKDIAAKLSVSTTQVSKWKNGEYISFDKEKELEKLAGIVESCDEWTQIVKSEENSNLWIEYLEKVSEYCDCAMSVDKEMSISLLRSIAILGIPLTSKPPHENLDSDITDEKLSKYFYLLQYVIENYSCITYWCDVFIRDYGKDVLFEIVFEIHDYAFLLAIINIDEEYLNSFKYDKAKFNSEKMKIKQELSQSLNEYCEALLKAGLPITSDYFDMLKQDPQWLEDEAMLWENTDSANKYLDYGSRKIYDNLHIINDNLLTLLEMIDKKPNEIKNNILPINLN